MSEPFDQAAWTAYDAALRRFRRSGRDVKDLGRCPSIGDAGCREHLRGVPGRVYANGCYIEHDDDGWILNIENTSESGPLETLEESLFAWWVEMNSGGPE